MNQLSDYSNQLLELMFENSHMPVAMMDCDFNFLRVNEAYASADNKSPEYFVGKNHFDLFPHEENERLFKSVVETGEAYRATAKPFEYEHNPERGVTHWDWTLVPVRDRNELIGVMLQLIDVTQHVETEQRFNKAQSLASAGSWEWKLAVDKMCYTDEMRRLLSLDDKSLCENFDEFLRHVFEEDIDEVKQFFDTAITNPDARMDISHRYYGPDNEIRYVHQYIEVERDKHNTVWRVVGTFLDITHQHSTETRLQQKQHELVSAQAVANIGTWDWEIKTNTLEWSDKIYDIFGVERESFGGTYDDFLNCIHPDDRQKVEQAVQHSLESESRQYNITHRVIRLDGVECTVEETGHVYFDDLGEPYRMVGVVQDISNSLQATLSLQLERDFANRLLDTAPVIIVLLDTRGYIEHANRYFEELSGYALEEIKGKEWFETFLPARDQEWVREVFDAASAGNSTKGNINAIVARNGEERLIEWYDQTMRDSQGNVTGVLAIGQDVTEKQHDAQVIQTQADIINQIHDSVVSTDLDGMITSWNKGAERIFQYSAEEAMGQPIAIVYPDEELITLEKKIIKPLKEKGLHDIECIMQKKDGKKFHAHLMLSMLYNEQGVANGMIGYTMDISQRKLAEMALQESELRFRTLVENVPGASYRCLDNDNRTMIFASKAIESLTGYGSDDFTQDASLSFESIIYPEDKARVIKEIQKAARKKLAFDIEYRIVHKSGEIIWVNDRGQAVYGPLNNIESIDGVMLDITEQKKKDEALAISEARYRRAEAGTQEGLWEWDITTGDDYFSPNWLSLLGFSENELPYHVDTFINLIHPDDMAHVKAAIEAHLGEKAPYNVEMRMRHKQGHYVWVQSTGTAEFDEQGEPVLMTGVIKDITERKQTDFELRKNQARLVAAQRIASIGNWELDVQTGELYWSDEIFNIFEIDKQQFAASYEAFLDAIHPEDREMVSNTYNESLENQEPYMITHRLLMKDGRIKHVREQCETVFNDKGTPLYSTGTVQDVTEIVEAEIELAHVKEMLEEGNRISRMGVWEFDLKTNTLEWSAITKEIHEVASDYQPEIETAINFYREGYDRDRISTVVGDAMKSGGSWDEELRIVTAKGNERWVRAMGQPEYEDGECVRLYGSFQDISDRKYAEDELQRQQKIISDLNDNLPGMIYQCRNDENWTLEFANKGVKDVTGYDQSDLLEGRIHYAELIHTDDAEYVWEEVQKALENKLAYTVRYRINNKEGKERWVWERGAGFYDEKGELDFLHGFITDVTEQKLAEDQIHEYQNHLEELVEIRTQELKDTQSELVKKERLATLGQLTATISHELRNPIGAMSTFLYVLKNNIDPDNPKQIEPVLRIEKNIRRCDSIIDQLLDYSRITSVNLSSIDLDKWLMDLLDELKIPEGVELTKELTLAGRKVLFDDEVFRRAVINVVDNACQAMTTDALGKEIKHDAKLKIASRLVDGKVEVCISDTGYGMTEDVEDKIYEPLFSTKSFGVGLGMPTVKQIMNQHEGGIDIKSKPNVGTDVTLWLPAA